ncbi:hypothetical protein [Dermacoccus nishinomiyaensis]|uniref:hypothetical protein n=1 Tax=Dermacoccus nishinomiyaensis TaxID=1274 RepID=UPI003F6C87CF
MICHALPVGVRRAFEAGDAGAGMAASAPRRQGRARSQGGISLDALRLRSVGGLGLGMMTRRVPRALCRIAVRHIVLCRSALGHLGRALICRCLVDDGTGQRHRRGGIPHTFAIGDGDLGLRVSGTRVSTVVIAPGVGWGGGLDAIDRLGSIRVTRRGSRRGRCFTGNNRPAEQDVVTERSSHVRDGIACWGGILAILHLAR